MYVYHMHGWWLKRSKVSGPLELEFQMAVLGAEPGPSARTVVNSCALNHLPLLPPPCQLFANSMFIFTDCMVIVSETKEIQMVEQDLNYFKKLHF